MEHHDLYFSFNIMLIKSRRMRRTGYVTGIWENRRAGDVTDIWENRRAGDVTGI
jgi:hypothetical protein